MSEFYVSSVNCSSTLRETSAEAAVPTAPRVLMARAKTTSTILSQFHAQFFFFFFAKLKASETGEYTDHLGFRRKNVAEMIM